MNLPEGDQSGESFSGRPTGGPTGSGEVEWLHEASKGQIESTSGTIALVRRFRPNFNAILALLRG
jgi:hypothetical protein